MSILFLLFHNQITQLRVQIVQVKMSVNQSMYELKVLLTKHSQFFCVILYVCDIHLGYWYHSLLMTTLNICKQCMTYMYRNHELYLGCVRWNNWIPYKSQILICLFLNSAQQSLLTARTSKPNQKNKKWNKTTHPNRLNSTTR